MIASEKINITDYQLSQDVVNKLANKKIYFAHQSVGGNIIDGLKEILDSNPEEKLNIVKSVNSKVLDKPVLMHTYIGENGDPLYKINEFKRTMFDGIGDKVDIAMMKFCYLDINKTTDIDEVFRAYKSAIDQVHEKFPEVKVVHVTVPLTVRDTGIRGIIKRIIGRPDNNIMRERYNEKITTEYGNREAIFDIARLESTLANGKRVENSKDNLTYYSLAPVYAADSGHLNRYGRLMAAKNFAEFLASNLD